MKFSKILAILLTVAMVLTMTSFSFAEESDMLSQPTDFTFDPYTGDFTFTATDARAAYYFVRIYRVVDGVEESTYTVTSDRIKGKTTGELSGHTDMSGLGWGVYTAKLCSYVATGSTVKICDPVSLKLAYGVGLTLEKPEMMVDYSGDRMEVVIDWVSLNDYSSYQYLPFIKVCLYSDPELTNEVYTQTFDTKDCSATFGSWGYDVKGGNFLHHLPDVEETHTMGGYDLGTPIFDIYYMVDNYPIMLEDTGLEAGTYYVTVQAIARDEYVLDSQVSEAIEIELTNDPFTSEYTCKKTSLWDEPWPWWSGPFAHTTVDHTERGDYGKYNPVSGIAVAE